MSRDTLETVTINSVERIGNTVNGNPRYKFHTDKGVYTLMSDASAAYKVTNYNYPVEANFTLTPAGRVRSFTVFLDSRDQLNKSLFVN